MLLCSCHKYWTTLNNTIVCPCASFVHCRGWVRTCLMSQASNLACITLSSIFILKCLGKSMFPPDYLIFGITYYICHILDHSFNEHNSEIFTGFYVVWKQKGGNNHWKQKKMCGEHYLKAPSEWLCARGFAFSGKSLIVASASCLIFMLLLHEKYLTLIFLLNSCVHGAVHMLGKLFLICFFVRSVVGTLINK